MAPNAQGLYNPAFEHDACGVAMVADMHGRRSRERATARRGVLELALRGHIAPRMEREVANQRESASWS